MKQRIVFVINSVGRGGAERVLDIILGARPDWARQAEIHLVLLDDETAMRAMSPPDFTHVLDGRGSLLRSIAQLHTLLDRLQPDLVVSFLIRSNLAAACWRWRGGKAPVIACERMHASSHLAGRYSPPVVLALRTALTLGYRRVDRVLAVSNGVADDLHRQFGVPHDRLGVIPNPYDCKAITAAAQDVPEIDLPPAYMVAVGRMVAAKNFAGLIDAFAAAKPSLDLVILGEGPERAALERLVAMRGLSERVYMPGHLRNPLPVVARSRFLISASRNEGFPNAIAEGMALGLPILSTDCPSGPAELLGGCATEAGKPVRGAAGLLTRLDDIPALAKGMTMLDADPELQSQLGKDARRRIEDFPQSEIVLRYWDVFRSFQSSETAGADLY